jgi:hypothetical protein
MIADRVYRKARSYNDAFIELRRCAGTQFDPELVERFIETVESRDQSRGEPEARVSKQAALNIGLQIERLTLALDQRDFATLAKMAGNLTSTAEQDGVPQIAALASQLEQASAQDPDLMNIVQLTTELLDLCRQTQRCYLDVSDVGYQPTYGAKP